MQLSTKPFTMSLSFFYEWHFNNEQPTEVGYCTFNLYEIEDKSLFSQPQSQPLEKKHYLNLSSALKTETL